MGLRLASGGRPVLRGTAAGYGRPAQPSARGCAAAYFPEANGLVPLDSTAEKSNTPTSKAVVVRLEPARVHQVAEGSR